MSGIDPANASIDAAELSDRAAQLKIVDIRKNL
jgi:hypothetical protein